MRDTAAVIACVRARASWQIGRKRGARTGQHTSAGEGEKIQPESQDLDRRSCACNR